MTFDLFGDPEPEAPVPAPTPAREDPAAAHLAAWLASRGDAMAQPCQTPQRGQHDHRCRHGGGSAAFSDDNGQSWFCMLHRPYGFLPSERFGHWVAG